jgi:hypothetical protein
MVHAFSLFPEENTVHLILGGGAYFPLHLGCTPFLMSQSLKEVARWHPGTLQSTGVISWATNSHIYQYVSIRLWAWSFSNIWQRSGSWWWWYINTVIVFLDIIYRPVLSETYNFSGALLIGYNWVGSTWRRRQNSVFETLCVLNKDRMMDNVQKHNNCIWQRIQSMKDMTNEHTQFVFSPLNPQHFLIVICYIVLRACGNSLQKTCFKLGTPFCEQLTEVTVE